MDQDQRAAFRQKLMAAWKGPTPSIELVPELYAGQVVTKNKKPKPGLLARLRRKYGK